MSVPVRGTTASRSCSRSTCVNIDVRIVVPRDDLRGRATCFAHEKPFRQAFAGATTTILTYASAVIIHIDGTSVCVAVVGLLAIRDATAATAAATGREGAGAGDGGRGRDEWFFSDGLKFL
jgi:hypothetical protein